MVMRGPDGADYSFHGVYREIAPPSRIVFSVIESGPAAAVRIVVTFEDEGGKTRVTVRQTVPALEEAARGLRRGRAETLEPLAEHFAAPTS
jgi:uncharacterized protein YndB with AHSA1/START domain